MKVYYIQTKYQFLVDFALMLDFNLDPLLVRILELGKNAELGIYDLLIILVLDGS